MTRKEQKKASWSCIFHFEGTTLYTKAFGEEGLEINSKTIVGSQKMSSPNTQKMVMKIGCDREILKSDGKSLAYIEVSFEDDKGFINTKGDNLDSFTLEGKDKILGLIMVIKVLLINGKK